MGKSQITFAAAESVSGRPRSVPNGRFPTAVAGPLLTEAFQVFECETIERKEMGDHWVIYGTVVAESGEAAVPLIFFNRDFARIA